MQASKPAAARSTRPDSETPAVAATPGRHAPGLPRGPRSIGFIRRYAVLILLAALFITLSLATESFLTSTNLLNILSQNSPLAIIPVALTFVVIGGGFHLSAGAIFAVANVIAAWVAVHADSIVL